MPSRHVSWSLALMAVVWCGCATGSGTTGSRVLVDRTELWPELADPAASADRAGAFPVRRPAEEQVQQLTAAEQAWRGRDDEAWKEARERLTRDPVAAFWLTRLLIHDVLVARRRYVPDVEAMVDDAPWERPIAELVDLGGTAAPCVTLDLLCSSATENRRFGIDVLSRMGPEHLTAWERVFDVDEPRIRRAAVEAIAAWGPQPRTLNTLLAAAEDGDFGVRAAAWRAFGNGGPEDAARLRGALSTEADPFVRRAIVESLSNFDDPATASTLVSEFEAALRARDSRLAEVCQAALRKVSGRDRDESLAYWQNWLATQHPGPN